MDGWESGQRVLGWGQHGCVDLGMVHGFRSGWLERADKSGVGVCGECEYWSIRRMQVNCAWL